MTLGEKIKEARKKAGLSQEQLAEKLGVSRSAVAKWETDKGIPDVDNLKVLSKLLNVSVDCLLDDGEVIEKLVMHEPYKLEETTYDVSKYAGQCYDIELNGWNDGVWNVFILGEDEDFLFYQKAGKKRNVRGLIGKKYITSIIPKKKKQLCNSYDNIDRNYFCGKRVFVEIACKEGFFKGFFDFRSDDYLDVVVNSFEDARLVLQFGRKINIETISKLEELDR